jgi:hypothetical protein
MYDIRPSQRVLGRFFKSGSTSSMADPSLSITFFEKYL